MGSIIAIAALLLASYLMLCFLRPASLKEAILFFYGASTGLVVLWGYALSSLNQINSLNAWAIAGAVTAMLMAILFLATKQTLLLPHEQLRKTIAALTTWYTNETGGFERALLFPMAFAALFSGIFNLVVIRYIAPHNWDSMAYHLARVAYYLQHGNFSYFSANYWAQVVHPKNSTLLLIYSLLASGGNEKLTALVQYLSYWIFVISIYGISRKAGLDITRACFSALAGSLLTEGILQATTTQNDMIIAAYFGVVVYCLFAFRDDRRWAYLFVAGIGLGLVIGTKASSMLALPSVGLIAAYLLIEKRRVKNLVSFGAFSLLGIVLFTLPSGYVENIRLFGHPMGPPAVREIHSFENETPQEILKGGTYNLLRYGFDFIALDGLPPLKPVWDVQWAIRFLPEKFVSLTGVHLEDEIATTFFPFVFDRAPSANEEHAYWGIWGFALIWPAVFFALIRREKKRDVFMLSLASILFFILQAYTNPYDLYRGRYFLICAVFALPAAGAWLSARSRLAGAFIFLMVFAGSVSAVSAAWLKTTYFSSNNFGVTEVAETSLFDMHRDQQLTFNNQKYFIALESFNDLVPEDAVVALFLYPNSFEYPLFGQGFTRTLIPINSFYEGPQPIPQEAQYLLYARGYPCAADGDRHLGADWYLRKLDNANRECEYPP